IAKYIHENSNRSEQPLIVQNCAAIPEQLLESELFGHKKGSFTGADKDKVGLFEAANGGTLFLDEIGDMPMLLQAKLLRVLQERKVRPIGTSKEIEVDVRV
ncbi:sigma-54 factor interaction domain-containing protein, partial [Vibrio parahaemolyticus]